MKKEKCVMDINLSAFIDCFFFRKVCIQLVQSPFSSVIAVGCLGDITQVPFLRNQIISIQIFFGILFD